MTSDQQLQRFIVDLPAGTARRAIAFLSNRRGAYRDLSELVVVALENQLRLEEQELPLPAVEATQLAGGGEAGEESSSVPATGAGSRATSDRPPRPGRSERPSRRRPTPRGDGRKTAREPASSLPLITRSDIEAFLEIPSGGSIHVDREPIVSEASLSPFTNRLNPLVVPVRVLVNLVSREGAPTIEHFTKIAPAVARQVGLRLKQEDNDQRRRGRDKRSTGWPVGDDEISSIGRFRRSFLFTLDAGVAAGPLVDLGLVALDEGRVHATRAALEMASEKTPVLDGGGDGLLSPRQQELFKQGLLRMAGERHELTLFFRSVHAGGGAQAEVDRVIGESHPGWTEAQVVSHRAAIIGRLRDIGLVDVSSPAQGQEIEIYLDAAAAAFEKKLAVEE